MFRYDCIIANFAKGFSWISKMAVGTETTLKFWILQPYMSKLLAALVYQEVFYQTSLPTRVTEPLSNIVPWDKNTGAAVSGCMMGALPLPLHKGATGVEAPFHKSIIDNFMLYQDRIEQICCSFPCTHKLQYVFCNFWHYFWGQHGCWTETSIIGNDFLLFFISLHCPQPFYCPAALPLFQRPCKNIFYQVVF